MIFDNYDQEPQDTFKKLTQTHYAQLYENDMGNFKDDLQFYLNLIERNDNIIEFGCGTGRITSFLHKAGYNIIGLDYSQDMLNIASKKCPRLPTIKDDITKLKLPNKFNKILVPYNFLNLFKEQQLNNTLRTCKNHLELQGKIIGEINCFDPKSDLAKNGTSFQFQISETINGKIIKEVKRKYMARTNSINVEERYRIRERGVKEDYNHTYSVNAYDFQTWQNILNKHDLQITSHYSNYDCDNQEIKSKLLTTIEHKG